MVSQSKVTINEGSKVGRRKGCCHGSMDELPITDGLMVDDTVIHPIPPPKWD
jgi:hypothetical protein